MLTLLLLSFPFWFNGKQRQQCIDAFEAQRLMFAFVHFYRECIRLENFAVMNYQGFSKVHPSSYERFFISTENIVI